MQSSIRINAQGEPITERKAVLLAGLAYGDEGKGSMVDYLVRREKAHAVVRYNGGAQAAHRVVLDDGREHVFAQFGSGTFTPGTRTHLSRFMLVEPFGLLKEYEHLSGLGFPDALSRLTIDEEAPVITPFHIAANRLLESSRGSGRYGSCGLGIGETMEDVRELGEDALRAGDLLSPSITRKKLELIQDRKADKLKEVLASLAVTNETEYNRMLLDSWIALDEFPLRYRDFARSIRIVSDGYLEKLADAGTLVFEGAQGLLLDPQYGIPPHITKTDITFRNAQTLLGEIGYDGQVRKVGVVRGYFTRHGAGPFPTEDAELTTFLPDAANKEHAWQGKFRAGYFNAVDARYALQVLGGVDELAVTCLDRMPMVPEWSICNGYAAPGRPRLEPFGPVATHRQAFSYAARIAVLSNHVGTVICSFGPTASAKVNTTSP